MASFRTVLALITCTPAFIVLPAGAAGPTPISPPSSFPVTINKSGSYELTGNLKLPNNTTKGIVIKASNVTINFNGFTLSSPGGGSKVGVDAVTNEAVNVVLTNGLVTGFGGTGIALGSDSYADKMLSLGNGGDGIDAGSGSLVTGCLANKNGGFGLNFADSTAGYTKNVINANTGTVSGGTTIGCNLCNGSTTCP